MRTYVVLPVDWHQSHPSCPLIYLRLLALVQRQRLQTRWAWLPSQLHHLRHPTEKKIELVVSSVDVWLICCVVSSVKMRSKRSHKELDLRRLLGISLCMLCSTLVCYAAVSPRNLSMLEYNLKFYENIRIAALTIAAPLFLILIVVDTAENNVNNLIGGFANAFTFGYLGCFVSQVIAATVIRLGVFLFWEPNVFDLAPAVPLPIIPWVLREHKYRPKRITLFIQDFITSCVVCPILEEFFKLFLLQRSVSLAK